MPHSNYYFDNTTLALIFNEHILNGIQSFNNLSNKHKAMIQISQQTTKT